MAAVALLKFTQTSPGANGQAYKGTTGISVTLENSSNTDVASWQIDLVYADPRSALSTSTPYAFNNNSNTPTASFTPDARGSYRFVLKVWNVINRSGPPTDTDIRVFNVPEPNGLVTPPAQRWPKPLPTPESGLAGAKANELNFDGQSYGWAGDGEDGLLDELIRRVDEFSPSTAYQETKLVDFDGQTSFSLSQTASSPTTVEMFINGSKQQYGTDYTVAGSAVTYLGLVALETTDIVEFWYLAGAVLAQGPSTKQESLSVSNGQQVFTLTQTPTESTSVAMYVNGVKQQHGTDYSVSGSTVTYNSTDLLSSDSVEFWYVIGPLSAIPAPIPLTSTLFVNPNNTSGDQTGAATAPFITLVAALAVVPENGTILLDFADYSSETLPTIEQSVAISALTPTEITVAQQGMSDPSVGIGDVAVEANLMLLGVSTGALSFNGGLLSAERCSVDQITGDGFIELTDCNSYDGVTCNFLSAINTFFFNNFSVVTVNVAGTKAFFTECYNNGGMTLTFTGSAGTLYVTDSNWTGAVTVSNAGTAFLTDCDFSTTVTLGLGSAGTVNITDCSFASGTPSITFTGSPGTANFDRSSWESFKQRSGTVTNGLVAVDGLLFRGLYNADLLNGATGTGLEFTVATGQHVMYEYWFSAELSNAGFTNVIHRSYGLFEAHRSGSGTVQPSIPTELFGGEFLSDFTMNTVGVDSATFRKTITNNTGFDCHYTFEIWEKMKRPRPEDS